MCRGEVKQFGPENGWMLRDKNHQREFMNMLEHEKQDEVWLSPKEMNSLSKEAKNQLAWKKQGH